MELKERIAKLRRIKNLTQAELAEKVGVTTRSIQNYELGTRVPKMDTVVKIAEALGVDEKVLMSDGDYFVIEAHEKYGSRGKKDAEELVKNATALFAGGTISERDKALVLEAIQEAYFEAKIINKKYTPKKYRKNDDSNSDKSD